MRLKAASSAFGVERLTIELGSDTISTRCSRIKGKTTCGVVVGWSSSDPEGLTELGAEGPAWLEI